MFESRHAWLFALLLSGCGDDATPAGGGGSGGDCAGPECNTTSTCVDGFQPLADGSGCEPTLPASPCAPGSARRIGEASCVPVGATTCAAGFVVDPSGWGCREVLPAAPCTGATMEVLGETTCQPVGDCSAPFPPATSTYFVDASYADAELDATHYRLIRDAMDAAPSAAVIAVERGVYVETLPVARSVTLVGRCAEEVIIEDAGALTFGIAGDTAEDVEIRGFTLRGHLGAIGSFGGTFTVEACVLEGNPIAALVVSEPGSVLRLRDSVVRGTLNEGGSQPHGVLVQKGGRIEISRSVLAQNELANLAVTGDGSSAWVSRSIIRDGFPQTAGANAGQLGAGIYGISGVLIEVEESAILDNASGGIFVGALEGDAPSTGSVTGSVVRGTRWNETSETARGVEVSRASNLSVSDTTIAMSEETNLLVTEGSTATVTQTTLLGPTPDEGQLAGVGAIISHDSHAELDGVAAIANRIVGVQVQQGASLVLTHSLVAETLPALSPPDDSGRLFGVGLSLRPPSTVEVRDSALERNRGAAALVPGPDVTATFTRTLFAETLPNEYGEFGRGLSMQDGAQVEVRDSAVLDCRESGVFVADASSKLTMIGSSVLRTSLDGGDRFGLGVALILGTSVTLDGCTIANSAGAGLAVSSSSCFVTGSTFYGNTVAVHSLGSSTVVEGDEPGGQPDALTISGDTLFVGNGTLFGTGSVPLPNPLPGPPDD